MTWVIEDTATANEMLTALSTALDDGAATAAMKLYDSGDTLLMTFTLPATCMSGITGGVATFDCDPDITGTYAADGTADYANIVDGDGTVILSTTSVGTSASDVVLSSLDIASGVTVSWLTGAISHG